MIPLPMVVDITGENYFPVATAHKAAAAKGLPTAKHMLHEEYVPGCELCKAREYVLNQRHLRAIGLEYDASVLDDLSTPQRPYFGVMDWIEANDPDHIVGVEYDERNTTSSEAKPMCSRCGKRYPRKDSDLCVTCFNTEHYQCTVCGKGYSPHSAKRQAENYGYEEMATMCAKHRHRFERAHPFRGQIYDHSTLSWIDPGIDEIWCHPANNKTQEV